jgi:phage terminase large subunit-like protein
VPGTRTGVSGSLTNSPQFAGVSVQCARFEAGQVFLPKEAPWLSEFLHEILAFPNARHDDQIDSVSHFLKRAETNETTFVMVATAVKIFQNGEVIGDTTDIRAR